MTNVFAVRERFVVIIVILCEKYYTITNNIIRILETIAYNYYSIIKYCNTNTIRVIIL